MAIVQRVIGDLEVTGTITADQGIDRSQFKLQANEAHPIELTRFRVWDAMNTLLTTGAADDLGLTTGTFGTAFPYLTSGDLNAAGAITRRARVIFPVPDNFVPGSNFFFTVEAGMLTAVASVSATVGVELFSYNGATLANTVAGDRVTTAAQTINSLTLSSIRFTINGSTVGLECGEMLDARITIVANSVTASTHFAVIAGVKLEIPIKA